MIATHLALHAAFRSGDPDGYWDRKLVRIYGRLPQETRVSNGYAVNLVRDVPAHLMHKPLSAAVALTQGNSPLDPLNSEALPHLAKKHAKLKMNLYGRGVLPGLRPIRKLSEYKVKGRRGRGRRGSKKGGEIFTRMINRSVQPIDAVRQ
jgi:hypothetical protein